MARGVRGARNQEVAAVTGMLALWIGAVLLAVAMDAAVNARLAVEAVRRYERRTAREMAVRSAAEFAAMVLQSDPDRARDTRDDAWAVAQLPDSGAYRGVWPHGARMTITDLERRPESALPVARAPSRAAPWRGRWLNVLSATSDAWESLGISAAGARGLVEAASRGIRDVREVTSAPGLGERDERVLIRLLESGSLGLRSELFSVHYCEPVPHRPRDPPSKRVPTSPRSRAVSCVEMLLWREPARGGVTMGPMQRSANAP